MSSIGTIYYTPTSCGAASYIAASVGKLKFDSEQVDIKQTHKTSSGKDFYTINPKGNVPTIATPHGVLSEGPAVLQYIADQAPNSGLAPAAGTFERYQLIDDLNFIGTELHKNIGGQFDPRWDAKGKEILTANAHKKLKYLEEHILPKSANFSTSKPTVAGIYLYIVSNWTNYLGIKLDAYPKLTKFIEEMKANPAIKEAHEKMNSAPAPPAA